jgi:hypothetical protein
MKGDVIIFGNILKAVLKIIWSIICFVIGGVLIGYGWRVISSVFHIGKG